MKLVLSALVGLILASASASAREVERPDPDELARARERVASLDGVRVAALNLVRRLNPAASDLERLPAWRRPQTLAPLGGDIQAEQAGEQAGEQADLPYWRKLRLAAMLRCGHPASEGLLAELDGYLVSKRPAGTLADSALELIVLEELTSTGDVALEGARTRACARRGEVDAGIAWPVAQPTPRAGTGQPTVARRTAETVVHEAICRELLRRARARGEHVELDLDGQEARFLSDLLFCLEAAAAPDTPAGGAWSVTVARSQRDRVFACALLTLAAAELGGVRDPRTQKQLAAARTTLAAWARAALDSTTSDWVFAGDSCALSALTPADMLPGGLRPITRALPPRALDAGCPAHLPPGVERMSLAGALGWMPRARGAATSTTAYPARALSPTALREQTQASAQALALLGATGGLVSREPVRPAAGDDPLAQTMAALTTLELEHLPLTFEERIGDALDRAGAHLATQQNKDGSFPGTYASQIGGQAVVLLAMCHAGVDRNHPAVMRGMKHLLGMIEGGATSSQIVYGYGIALMLMQEIYRPEQQKLGVLDALKAKDYRRAVQKMWKMLPARDRKLVGGMVKALASDYAGLGWGYSGPTRKLPGKGSGGATTTGDSWCDNSNACYALLGLKAASFLGAPFDRRLFAGEAQRLLGTYVADAKMDAIKVALERGATATMASVQPGGWIYSGTVDLATATTTYTPTRSITANCLAGLAVCRDELRMNEAWSDESERAGRRAFAGGLHWLGARTDYPASLAHAIMNTGSSDGHGLFYELYGLERACVLTATDTLDGVDWYHELGTLLVDAQAPDGSWPDLLRGGTPQMVNTSFVVLILARSAVPTHEKPKPVITGE